MKKIKLLKALAFPVSAWFAFTVGSTVIHAQEQTIQPKTVEVQGMNEDDLSTPVEEKEIEDGTYTITSAVDENKALDAYAAGTSNGTNVDSYDANGSNAQYWSIQTNEDGSKTIQNLNSGQVLDVAGGQGGNGNNVQLYDANGTNAQKWRIVNNGDGYYTIQSMINTGYVLDLAGASKDNGANVQIYQQNQSLAQLWKFTFVSKLGNIKTEELKELEGKFNIGSASNSNYLVDVSGGSTSNGANINLYGDNQSRAQVWNLSIDSDGYATFTNDKTNAVLDLNSGTVSNGSNIQLYENNGTKAQKWILVRNGSSYEIRSALNLRYGLDIYAGSNANGTNIQLYQVNGSNAQKWLLNTFVSAYELGGTSEEELNSLPKITYIQSSKDNNYVMDMKAGSFDNFGNVQLYLTNGSDAQAWKLVFSEYGYLTIYNYNSGKALDIDGARFMNGANIQQYDRNSSIAQVWYLEKTDEGYVIRSKKVSHFVLDLSAGITQNEQNIQLYSYNGSLAQKWNFAKFTPSSTVSYVVNQKNGGYIKSADGGMTGSTNGNAIQTLLVNLGNVEYDGDLSYQVSTREGGWQSLVSSGVTAGAFGQSIEAFRIMLNGEVANHYNIYYRSWIDDFGWLAWASNGYSSGSDRTGRDISSIAVRLVRKEESVFPEGSVSFIENGTGYLDGNYVSSFSYGGGLAMPHYNQRDYTQAYGDDTIAESGCGPSSFSMVVSYLTGREITPYDAVAWCGNAYYVYGVGTSWSYFNAASQHFGISAPTLTFDANAVLNALRSGRAVISSQGRGLFTNGGHFIVLRGITPSGRVLVNDPYDTASKNYFNREFDFYSEVNSTSSAYWIF